MNFLVIISLFAAVTSLASTSEVFSDTKYNSRIINGKSAKDGQFPWAAFVMTMKNGILYRCGGALICDRFVLTSAHCTQWGYNIQVYLGSVDSSVHHVVQDRLLRSVSQIRYHPLRNSILVEHDMALLQLSEAVTFSDNVEPIPLFRNPVDGDVSLTTMGWGILNNDYGEVADTLQYVDVTSMTNTNCERYFDTRFLHNETLCLQNSYGTSICTGDGGSPIVRRNINGRYGIVGIFNSIHRNYCTGRPTTAMRISTNYDWILANVQRECSIDVLVDDDSIWC